MEGGKDGGKEGEGGSGVAGDSVSQSVSRQVNYLVSQSSKNPVIQSVSQSDIW